MAATHRFLVRIGLENGRSLPDGGMADSNADLLRQALKYYRN